MIETLKSLRTLHSALGIVMAAIVLISITSSQVRHYEQALEELQTLKKLSWQEYVEFCLALLEKDFKSHDVDETRTDYIGVFRNKYKLDTNESLEIKLLPIVLIPPQGVTLATYKSFFSSKTEIGYYRPPLAEEVAKIVTTDFDDPKNEPDKFTPKSTIHYVDIVLLTDPSDTRTLKLSSETVVITKLLLANQLKGITKLYYTTPPSTVVQERISLGNLIPLTSSGDFAHRWLQSNQSSLLGRSSASNQEMLLPHASSFWQEPQRSSLPQLRSASWG